jgi:glucose/arabinose dehydrogenase
MLRRSALWLIVIVAALLSLVHPVPVRAATVPAGFTDAVFAGGLSGPTSAAFAPDGRLFVTEQGGIAGSNYGWPAGSTARSSRLRLQSQRDLTGAAYLPAARAVKR